MRKTALSLLLAASGCSTFASYARRSNGYPGSYDRTLREARLVGDRDLATTVETLGASRDYNESTHDLLWCLDHYADAELWQRQSETGNFLTRAKLEAYARDNAGQYGVDDELRAMVSGTKNPEEPWLDDARECADACHAVLQATGADAAMPRDAALASKYESLCATSVTGAQQAALRSADRALVANAAESAKEADSLAAKGCFWRASKFLGNITGDIARVHDAKLGPPMRAQAEAVRTRYADGFARVDAFESDPIVVALQKKLARLGDARDLAEVASRDAHAAAGSGDGEWAERAAERADAVDRVGAGLRDDEADLHAQLMAIARQSGVLCR